MKIALLEDDQQLSLHLNRILQSQGWQVSELSTIGALDRVLEDSENTDLLILDRMIGEQDSIHSIKKIKAQKPLAKILILSSIDLPEEKAKWLMAGVDEYMGKPVFSDELIARIHLLMKRRSENPSIQVNLGNLTIDKFKHQVTSSKGKLDLTAKEYGLLMLLAEQPGKVINKTQALEHLWDIKTEVETNVFETTINHLRRKLEEGGSTPAIKSKRNLGYWLEV